MVITICIYVGCILEQFVCNGKEIWLFSVEITKSKKYHFRNNIRKRKKEKESIRVNKGEEKYHHL